MANCPKCNNQMFVNPLNNNCSACGTDFKVKKPLLLWYDGIINLMITIVKEGVIRTERDLVLKLFNFKNYLDEQIEDIDDALKWEYDKERMSELFVGKPVNFEFTHPNGSVLHTRNNTIHMYAMEDSGLQMEKRQAWVEMGLNTVGLLALVSDAPPKESWNSLDLRLAKRPKSKRSKTPNTTVRATFMKAFAVINSLFASSATTNFFLNIRGSLGDGESRFFVTEFLEYASAILLSAPAILTAVILGHTVKMNNYLASLLAFFSIISMAQLYLMHSWGPTQRWVDDDSMLYSLIASLSLLMCSFYFSALAKNKKR